MSSYIGGELEKMKSDSLVITHVIVYWKRIRENEVRMSSNSGRELGKMKPDSLVMIHVVIGPTLEENREK